MGTRKILFLLTFLFFWTAEGWSQDSVDFGWKVSSRRLSGGAYALTLSTPGAGGWDLYGFGQQLGGVPAADVVFKDSAIGVVGGFGASGPGVRVRSALLDDSVFTVYRGPVSFEVRVQVRGRVPAVLLGTLHYTYGRGQELYPGTAQGFSVALEGGEASALRIRIASLDAEHPVADCGDQGTAGRSLWGVFLLGMLGGFIGLLTPCVFPLIPLTVSFFTRPGQRRKKGVWHALLYGFFIWLIYILLSVPFHLVSGVSPEILNNLSTSVWLNLVFFVIFVVFAFSFFGYFEIGLPGGLATRVDTQAGLGTVGGIFFMALTLAIVSFSCTGPILGSLLAGTASQGAWPLTAGLGGFGLALALPFGLFALFPGWLQSLPRSGGWLTSVKVVLGFLELAMAMKFLSNADLVSQWGLVHREVFIGSWVVCGILIVSYLGGWLRFRHDGPRKSGIGWTRGLLMGLFGLATLYLAAGLTNTRWANLSLISGFPPPLCYSVYRSPVNCTGNLEPLRDYEQALAQARQQGKPLLIDFTGWACVNCRRMEENVWTDGGVKEQMKGDYVVVSLYVDERKGLGAADQQVFVTRTGSSKAIVTVGDRWATFQSENFGAVSQPQYAIVDPRSERVLTRTKGYTRDAGAFGRWLQCGRQAYKQGK